ncbi:MAG: aldehyde dehydrogenase family protein [Mycoplasma sp.]
MINLSEKQRKILINGELYSNENWIDVTSPIDNSIVVQVPALNASEIKFVFESAQAAFSTWRHVGFIEKEKLVSQWIESIKRHKDEFVSLMVREIAKSQKDATIEVDRTISLILETVEIYKTLLGDSYDGQIWGANNKHAFSLNEPKGVILAIAPFNYPLNLAVSKIIPALITGNTVVFKPASFSSGIGALIGLTIHEANFPAGVFNVVTGKGSEIGDLLTSHPYIKLINFTGSTATGNYIASKSGLVEFIFELGGKDPAIVIDDNDLELYASQIVKGAYSYNGQRCTAVKRVITTKEIGKKLTPIITKKVSSLKIGSPKDNCDITPIVDTKSIYWVLKMVEEAKEEGAISLLPEKVDGNLIYPILLDNVKRTSKIAIEEPFAPILPIIYCETFEEMIDIANESPYGLQACIFGNDYKTILTMAKKLEAGSININTAPQRGPDAFPFSGVKGSGIGTQGIKDALLAHIHKKLIVLNF